MLVNKNDGPKVNVTEAAKLAQKLNITLDEALRYTSKEATKILRESNRILHS